eukprot:14080197-Alexandrium_andersonii.AAC.1
MQAYGRAQFAYTPERGARGCCSLLRACLACRAGCRSPYCALLLRRRRRFRQSERVKADGEGVLGRSSCTCCRGLAQLACSTDGKG